jgi:beta-lactamase regulating signal transducer with metallopeptidase domain
MSALEAIFLLVCDTSWRAGCLIVVVFVLRPLLMGRVPARVLFWAWIAVAIRLLVFSAVPVAWSPFGLVRLIHPARAPAAAQHVGSDLKPVNATPRESISVPPSNIVGVQPRYLLSASSAEMGAAVWGIGMVVLLFVRVAAGRRFARRLRMSSVPVEASLASVVAEAGREFGFSGIEVVVTDAVEVPAIYGIFRPKLLFPPRFTEKLTACELRLIVAHELGHGRHRDPAAHAVIHAAQVLHWFNPLVWLAARTAKGDCEIACDEFVLRRSGWVEPRFYGATLLRIAGMARVTSHAPVALGVIGSRQQIRRRIERIVAYRSPAAAGMLFGWVFLAAIIVFGATREGHAQQSASAEALPLTMANEQLAGMGGLRTERKPRAVLHDEMALAVAVARAGLVGPSLRREPAFNQRGQINLPSLSMVVQAQQLVDLSVSDAREFRGVPYVQSFGPLAAAAQQKVADRLDGVLDGSLKVMETLQQLRRRRNLLPDDQAWRMAHGLPERPETGP